MSTIAAAIMAKNEASDIGACIESVLWMNEVVVLDSGSTDGTQDICRKYGVNVVETDWPGFGEQSNRALCAVNADWCFLIDADERVPKELKQELVSAISKHDKYVAYRVPRLNYFYNRNMAHCLNSKGDNPIRLLKKGVGRFSEIVHQSVSVDGEIGELKHTLIHFPYKNLEEILYKANSYSTLGVDKLLKKGVKGSISKAFLHAIWTFIRMYIIKMGFLDGWPGFLIAFSNFEYTFYKYAKLMEIQRGMDSGS